MLQGMRKGVSQIQQPPIACIKFIFHYKTTFYLNCRLNEQNKTMFCFFIIHNFSQRLISKKRNSISIIILSNDKHFQHLGYATAKLSIRQCFKKKWIYIYPLGLSDYAKHVFKMRAINSVFSANGSIYHCQKCGRDKGKIDSSFKNRCYKSANVSRNSAANAYQKQFFSSINRQ